MSRGPERGTGHADAQELAARWAIGGAVVWSVALLSGPALRPDLDPWTTHPETYAIGAWGALMRLGYAGVGVAGWAAAFLARRYRVASALLAVFATCALAIGLLPPSGRGDFADQVFPYLQVAPLAFLPAVASISLRIRRRVLVALAAAAWLLFAPLVLGQPALGGIINRAADLAIGIWIGVFAWTARDGLPA